MQPFVSFGGEKLALAKLAAQVLPGVGAEICERHVDGAGGAHDGSSCLTSSFTEIFPAEDRSVTARLFERFVRTLGRAESGVGEFKRLKDFSFHQVFPGGAGHLLGHRARNRVADIRVRKLLARRVVWLFGEHIQHRLSTR